MILGQSNFRKELRMAYNENAPRFSLIIGQGKSQLNAIFGELAKEYFDNLVVAGNKVADVREVIDLAYTKNGANLYVFHDVDSMSLGAKNALLKVTEEPPNKAHFIMVAQSADDILPTLVSRARVFEMDAYTTLDIVDYAMTIDNDEKRAVIAARSCTTPDEVLSLYQSGQDVIEFDGMVYAMVTGLSGISLPNLFKVGAGVALSKSAEGIAPEIFMNAVSSELSEYLRSETVSDLGTIAKVMLSLGITSQAKRDIGSASLSKKMTFDNWLIELWEVWNNANS